MNNQPPYGYVIPPGMAKADRLVFSEETRDTTGSPPEPRFVYATPPPVELLRRLHTGDSFDLGHGIFATVRSASGEFWFISESVWINVRAVRREQLITAFMDFHGTWDEIHARVSRLRFDTWAEVLVHT